MQTKRRSPRNVCGNARCYRLVTGPSSSCFSILLARGKTNEYSKHQHNQPHRASTFDNGFHRICSGLRDRTCQRFKYTKGVCVAFAKCNGELTRKQSQPGCESFTRRIVVAQGQDPGR